MGKTQKIVGLILMLVALGLAAYAWMLSSRMAAEQKAAQPRMLPVVVAKSRIPAGSVIRAEMLKVSMFPSRPDGSFSDVGSVAGKIASTDIAVDEAVLHERLGDGLRSLLQRLDPNERAVAIRVDEVIAVGNKLVPGDMVDVFFTLRRDSSEIANTQSRLLLEKLPVLAFGNWDVGTTNPGADGEKSARTAEKPRTAVLAVKTEDIDKLVLAAESGRLILALRPHEQPAPEVAATTAEASAGGAVAPVAAVATPATTNPKALTLKQLIAMTQDCAPATTAARAPSGNKQRPVIRKPSESVIVMHGLEEKTVNFVVGNGAKP